LDIHWLGRLIKRIIFPLGYPYTEPSDYLGKRAARILISDNPARDRLTEGIFRSCGADAAGLVNCAFSAVLVATGTPSQAVVPVHGSVDRRSVHEPWWVLTFRDREQQGRCDRAYTDVFTACPWV